MSAFETPTRTRQGKQKKANSTTSSNVELLSLFFAQYQTFEERMYSHPDTSITQQVFTESIESTSTKKAEGKGKEKMTEEEEEEAARVREAERREEEESGEEGVLDSLHSEDDLSHTEYADDEAYYLEHFEVDDCFDNEFDYPSASTTGEPQYPLDYYTGFDFDMTEDDYDVVLEEEGERWERRLVSIKQGGHVVRRHSRAHKKPRVRPDRWVKARDSMRDARRGLSVISQATAHQTNATRGLVYRTIDYHSIRENAISTATTSPPPASSTPASSSSTSSSTTARKARSSSSNGERVPFYEREITSAIDRGSAVQCGLSAGQLNDLLNRELTPEDYEMLLMLDTTVKPKTLSTNLIDSFPSHTLHPDSALVRNADQCAICMCAFESGEGVKELPLCHHSFHAECIVQWLSTASTKCPLCSASLEP